MDSVDQRSDCTESNEMTDSVDQRSACIDNNEKNGQCRSEIRLQRQ